MKNTTNRIDRTTGRASYVLALGIAGIAGIALAAASCKENATNNGVGQPSGNDTRLGAPTVTPLPKEGTTPADNTEVNARDVATDFAATADSAPMEGSDLELTAQVRRALMADDSLSINATNAKILVNRGQVTLRGPVDSADEKRRVQGIVAGLVGAARIDNQLEVAAP